MSKHISPDFFYKLPSGSKVHPCRLILKDGSLMWKHALLHENVAHIPTDEAHESHIIKTAQRLEELNSWVSQSLEPWDCIVPHAWYVPTYPELDKGISVYFRHPNHDLRTTLNKLLPHIMDHEEMELRNNYLFFKRC